MEERAHNPAFPQLASNASDRRRAGRLKTPGVTCDWGQVLDLSSTGLRVLHKGSKPANEGTETTLTIRSRLAAFKITARIVHAEKIGFRKWQLGVQIVETDEEARKELSLLARAAAQGGSVYD